MAPLKILTCGGGIAGPALAFWLARGGHRVTIVEHFPVLRATGTQIDLRGQGIEAINRMGLLETVRSKLVDEEGLSFVNSQDNVIGTVLANKSGKGKQTFTSEYEIMRGDLVRILYAATKDNVEYVFGKSVERFEQNDEQVIAYFSDGSCDTYDMLVGADGQGSRIRRDILPADSPDPYHRMGLLTAYWMIPRLETEDNISKAYLSTGGRMILQRSHSATETQVYLLLRDSAKELSSVPKAPADQQKEFWAQRFRDAGWQVDRFLEGMKAAENFYSHEVVQVRIDKWHKGRVVLVGDAAYCPSPMSGMGTSSSLIGAYVLAGAVNRHSEDLSQAFADYEETLNKPISLIERGGCTSNYRASV